MEWFFDKNDILGSSTNIPTTTVPKTSTKTATTPVISSTQEMTTNIPIETITSTVATSTQETSSQGKDILHWSNWKHTYMYKQCFLVIWYVIKTD